jgi:hypothetical protein
MSEKIFTKEHPEEDASCDEDDEKYPPASICGFFTESYMRDHITEGKCEGDYNFTKMEFKRHILVLQRDSIFYTITLSDSETICQSGWCISSFAELKACKSHESVLAKITHIPKDEPEEIDMDVIMNDPEDFSCNCFNFSAEGPDSFYPSGFYKLDETLFIEK